MQKNVAGQTIGAQMVSATDGSAFTSAVTVHVTLDAGTQAQGSVGSGACTHEGNGYHTYAPAQAETNGDLVAFTFVGTGAIPSTVQIYTRVDANVTVMAANVLTATAINADAITAAKLAADVTTELQSGLATAANLQVVDDNVDAILADTDDIGVAGAGLTAVPWNASWDAQVESEVADALAVYDPPTKAELDTAVANVSVDEIQATALADLFNTDSGTTYASAVAGSPVKEIADNAGGSALTEAGIADAVWDEATAGHTTSGTFGEQVKTDVDAILADSNELQTDWVNGGRLDNILDARASQTSVDTIDNFLDTEIDAILTDTSTTLDTKLNSILSLLDDARTEPGSGALPVNPDAITKLDYLYKFLRNKKDNDGSVSSVYGDDGSTVHHTQTTVEASGTTTVGEWEAP